MFTDWKPQDNEVFRFLHTTYDVDKAKVLLAKNPRESSELVVATCKQFIGGVPPRGENPKALPLLSVHIEWEKVWRMVDNPPEEEVPVILSHYGEYILPIDGWHRIAKAMAMGMQTVPAVILELNETRKIATGLPRGTLPKSKKRALSVDRPHLSTVAWV